MPRGPGLCAIRSSCRKRHTLAARQRPCTGRLAQRACRPPRWSRAPWNSDSPAGGVRWPRRANGSRWPVVLRAEDRQGDRWRSSWATNGRASAPPVHLRRARRAATRGYPFVIRDIFFMSGDDTTLEDLRRRLNEIDRRLLATVAERKEVSREVARVKRATGRATRDYEREREVILGVRAAAQELGVSPALAEDLLRLLIRSSLTTQEQASVAARGAGSGRRVLVIGGAGLMGRWFVDFLSSQGFAVEVADPAGGAAG